MSLISRLRSHHLKPRVYPGFYNVSSNRSAISLIKHFCSAISIDEPPTDSVPATEEIPENSQEMPKSEQPRQTSRGRGRCIGTRQNPEKVDVVICKMMSQRAWTTRLQNSIRNLVPKFDECLVLGVLDKARNAGHALQFFRWVERSHLFKHTRDTHMKIIQTLGRASKLNHARCILMDMPAKGVPWDEDMFVCLIDSYGQSGIVQESVKIFQNMPELGVNRTVDSYNVLFKVILRRGRYMMAKRYYNKMIEAGIVPTSHTFNLLLWGFFLSKRETTAIRFYEDMKSRGIMPDVVTYNTLINGFLRLNKIEEAEKLFVEMKGKNIAPTVISYTTMIKGYLSSGKVEEALKMFEEMKGYGINPNAVTYTTLLPGLCDSMKVSEACMVLKDMVERRIKPKDNSIFIKLLASQCKLGNLDAAYNVLESMTRLRIPVEAGHYGILIENFCKTEVYDRAVKLLDILMESEIILSPQSTLDMEPPSYNAIIEYLCNNGKTQKAETLFRQLMKKGVKDPIAFNNLIRGHSKEGNPEAAFDIQKIMLKMGVLSEADSYILLVSSFLEKGEPADAKVVLDSMIENGHYPDSALFRMVMEDLFKDERVQTASRVMKTMLEKGVKDNMDLAANILEKLFMRGHVEEALGRIELLMQSGCAVDIDHLLSVLSQKGETIAALKLLDFSVERCVTLDFSSYDKVLDSLLAAGKTLSAYSILCKISRKGGSIDLKNIQSLIKTLNQDGNTKQADILRRLMTGEKLTSPEKGKKQPKQEFGV